MTLENLEKGMDYRLVATNNVNSLLSAENSFTYGDRIVVYVDYQMEVIIMMVIHHKLQCKIYKQHIQN